MSEYDTRKARAEGASSAEVRAAKRRLREIERAERDRQANSQRRLMVA